MLGFFWISLFLQPHILSSDQTGKLNIHRTIVGANAELQGRCAVLSDSQTQTAVAGSGKVLLMDPPATSVWPLGRQTFVQETLRWNKFSFTSKKNPLRATVFESVDKCSGSLEWQRKKKKWNGIFPSLMSPCVCRWAESELRGRCVGFDWEQRRILLTSLWHQRRKTRICLHGK